MSHNKLSLWVLAALIGLLVAPVLAGAQPSIQGPDGDSRVAEAGEAMEVQADVAPGFYYQGVLTEAGEPVNGTRSMEFQLWDAASGGNQVGGTIAQSVPVSQGQFSVGLSWGAGQIDGRALWLRVRAMDGAGAWQDLGRKEIRAVPYAMSLFPGAVVTDRGALTTTLKLDGGTGLSARGLMVGVVGKGWGPAEVAPMGGQFTSDNGVGVYGSSSKTYGVQGHACNSPGCIGGYFIGHTGVRGWSTQSHGVNGQGCDDPGCYGGYFTGDSGIYAAEEEDEGADYAGYFKGDVTVTDQLDVGGPSTFAQTVGITGALDVNNKIEADALQVKGAAAVDGILAVGGAAIGFFPRPAWDSGWQPLEQNEHRTLTHNLGGSTDNYVVDMQCKDTTSGGKGVTNRAVGGDGWYLLLSNFDGGWYENLTTSTVEIYRQVDDSYCNHVRVRIWVYK